MSNLVDCFKHLLPAIERGRVQLVYDACIEDRQLSTGQHIKSSISTLDADVRKLWYVFSKNHAHQASSDLIEPLVINPVPNFYLTKNPISQDLLCPATSWLSFSGQPWTESLDYEIVATAQQKLSIKNAHNLDTLIQLLPSYEESPKHHQEAYFANGEYVSPMPLKNDEASHLLLISAPDLTGTDRWAYHEKRKKYFRFKLTHIHGNVYHGFEVESTDVPLTIQQLLTNRN